MFIYSKTNFKDLHVLYATLDIYSIVYVYYCMYVIMSMYDHDVFKTLYSTIPCLQSRIEDNNIFFGNIFVPNNLIRTKLFIAILFL